MSLKLYPASPGLEFLPTDFTGPWGGHTWFDLGGDFHGPSGFGPGVHLSGELLESGLVLLQLDHKLAGVDDVSHSHKFIFPCKTINNLKVPLTYTGLPSEYSKTINIYRPSI